MSLYLCWVSLTLAECSEERGVSFNLSAFDYEYLPPHPFLKKKTPKNTEKSMK